jgi:hypothetical protein
MATLLMDANNFLNRHPMIRGFFWLLVAIQVVYYMINPISLVFSTSKLATWTIAGWWWAVAKTIYTLFVQLCFAVPSTAIVYFGVKRVVLPLASKFLVYLTTPAPPRPTYHSSPESSYASAGHATSHFPHSAEEDYDVPLQMCDDCREREHAIRVAAFVEVIRMRAEQERLDEEEREWHRRNEAKRKRNGKKKGRKK